MLISLLLPALLSAVAVFFCEFSVLDGVAIPQTGLGQTCRGRRSDVCFAQRLRPTGQLHVPGPNVPGDMNSPEFQAKYKAGPKGVLTVFGDVNMGRNLGLTFVLFLVVSVCLGYLAGLHIPPGAGFRPVFRFVSTAALLAYLTGILQHSIWFQCRVTGHILESLAYAAITGAIFGAMWPAAV